jgi:hypothetical protein
MYTVLGGTLIVCGDTPRIIFYFFMYVKGLGAPLIVRGATPRIIFYFFMYVKAWNYFLFFFIFFMYVDVL